MNPKLSILCAVLLLPLGQVSSPFAQWPREGVRLSTGSAQQARMVSDGAGGAIVTWADYRDSEFPDIYAQRATAEGLIAPGWPSDGLPVCREPTTQGDAQIASDGAGGAYVVWLDYRDYFSALRSETFIQRITSDGRPAPGWPENGVPVCILPGDQFGAQIAPDGDGGVFVAWSDMRRDPNSTFTQIDFYCQRITPQGTPAPGWPADGLPICTAPGNRSGILLLPDGHGGVFMTWADGRDLIQSDIYALRITAEGTVAPGWTPGGTAICQAPNHQGESKLTSDLEGGLIVTWVDIRGAPWPPPVYTDPFWDIYAQRVTGEGSIAPGWPTDGTPLCTAERHQYGLGVVSDGAGGAIAVWTDYRNYSENASDIYAQRVRGDGTLAPGWPADGIAVAASPGRFDLTEYLPALVPDGRGGALLAFDANSFATGYQLFVQQITAAGEVAPGWPQHGALMESQCAGENPAAISDDAGGMLVAWERSCDVGSYATSDIYVQWVRGDCPALSSVPLGVTVDPPVLNPRSQGRWLTLHLEPAAPHAAADIEVGSLRVNGTQTVDGAASMQATDLDRDGIEELAVRFDRAALAAATPAGEDTISLRVTGKIGSQCLYGTGRVRVVGQAASSPAVATDKAQAETVSEPPSDRLTLAPNPAGAEVMARFYQRDLGPGTLTLYDVGGRAIAMESMEPAALGWRSAPLRIPSQAPAGVYFVRLSDAQGIRSQRLLVVR